MTEHPLITLQFLDLLLSLRETVNARKNILDRCTHQVIEYERLLKESNIEWDRQKEHYLDALAELSEARAKLGVDK